jgi:diacylglycerol kinase family enzyme
LPAIATRLALALVPLGTLAAFALTFELPAEGSAITRFGI